MQVLLTGFNPFGGEKINPSFEAIKLLPDKINNVEIIKVEIPTEFKNSITILENAITKYTPDIVISVGQAGGRLCVTPEFVSINYADAKMPDNAGFTPCGKPLIENGDTAYFTTLPIKAMIDNVKKHGLPCNISYSAGTYVCNNVMYNLLYMANTKYKFIKGAGFIHVPFITEQVINRPNMPSMSLNDIAKSLELCIDTAISNLDNDIKISMGEIH